MNKIAFLVFICSSIFAQKSYFQQYVTYDIAVTLDDSLHTLSAFEKIEYTNNSPDKLDFLWFHIWPNAYKNNTTAYGQQALKLGSTWFYFANENERGYIDSLDFKVNGTRIDWEYHSEWIDVVKLKLTQPIKSGETVIIETPFFVKLPKVFSRLGHSGKHYEITQWYPKPAVYDKAGWHPMPYLNMGEFYSEFGTFDVKITLPENYRIMATGDLIDGAAEYAWLDSLAAEGDKLHELEGKAFDKALSKYSDIEDTDKLKTLHFHQENVHDFAWFADRKWIVRKGAIQFEESNREVTLWSMYLPKNAKLWENSIEYLHDATYWYSKFYLEYPYNHVTAVDGDLSAGGGMEYPNITVIAEMPSKDLLEMVIMHEVGHNWFYGIIGSNERDHAWMDEGLNEYTNLRYWDKKYGERGSTITISDFVQNKLKIGNDVTFAWITYLAAQMRAVTGDEQPIDIPSTEIDRGNYGSLIYGKTGIYTYYLLHYLGEDLFDKIMQEFFAKWKFKHPQPQDFRDIFEKNTDKDLAWYFDGVLNDTKTVDYKIKKDGDSFKITNTGNFKIPFEIAFYNKNKQQISSKWIEGFDGTKSISAPTGSASAIIDPRNILPDLNKTNNSTKHSFDLDFAYDQPNYNNRTIFWLPWVFNFNEYNGWTPGAMFYSGYSPTFNYGVSLKPMWDFRNNKLVGSAQIQKKLYQIFGIRELTVSAGYSDYQGRKGAKISLNGLVRQPIISTPSTRINATIYTHDIEKEAVTSKYYSAGKFVVGELGYKFSNKLSPLLHYSTAVNFMSSFRDYDFSKMSFSGDVNWRQSKRNTVKLRGWLGHFLNDSSVPRQYRNYLSGGLDPNFNSNFVLNRMRYDDNILPVIYQSQFITDGPSLRGIAKERKRLQYSDQTSWGINLTQTFTNLPLEIFTDYAGATDLEKNYFNVGITFDFSVLKIIVPLYQSWDEDSFISDFDWLKDRIRFELAFDMNSISF